MGIKPVCSRGFSTLEITVALGLMALLAIAAASLVKNIGSQQGAIIAKDEASEFVGALSLWMGTEKGCQASLVGKSLAIGGSAPVIIDGFQGYGVSKELNSGSTAMQANYRVSPTVKIKALTLRDKGVPASVMRIESVNYRRVVAQLEIEMETKTEAGEMGQRKRYVEVPVLLHESNDTIVKCAGEPTLSDLCSAVGSILDPATGMCRPLVNCTTQGTFMSLSCSPEGYGCYNASGLPLENAITHAQSCPAGSVPSQTGIFNYSHQVECGKKCVLTIADTLTFNICMRCN